MPVYHQYYLCSPSRATVIQHRRVIPGRRLSKSALVAAVQRRLADRQNWTQNKSAADANKLSVGFSSPRAQSWCLTGAINRELTIRGFVHDHLTTNVEIEITKAFREQFPELEASSLVGYNDHPDMTHEGVKLVLEKVYGQLIERGE